MKKTYTTPTVILSGSAVRDTRDVTFGPGEPAAKLPDAGSVGFNL